MPVWPSVADLPFEEFEADDDAGEPRYISLFFLTPGVARVVLVSFWHFAQTMMMNERENLACQIIAGGRSKGR